jgi:hypothetical protein
MRPRSRLLTSCSFAVLIGVVSFACACQPSGPNAAPTPAPAKPVSPATPTPKTPAPAAPAAAQTAGEPATPAAQIAAEPALKLAVEPKPAPDPNVAGSAKVEIFSGTHKLGVNRVTDMARVGRATFSERGGALHLNGRVVRGPHWLELSGRVDVISPKRFVLIGTLRGIPDMSWADEAPRERNTQGRFMFEVRHGRPYFRLYEIDGRECVCNDGCGNDFCYIDIEQQPLP